MAAITKFPLRHTQSRNVSGRQLWDYAIFTRKPS
jgi:hypothetical protein